MKMIVQKSRRTLALFLLGAFCCCQLSAAAARQLETPNVIRVGWYDYDGFFMCDEEGYRSGYGYDYLQELADYGGWNYEYIEGSVKDCLDMLADGRVDMMGAVMYSESRANTMLFSEMAMGENYSVLTVRGDDDRYQLGAVDKFNGIHIGVLRADLRQKMLEAYAAKNHFNYRVTEYDTPTLMENALANQQVDAILTTNMRVSKSRERMIAQFAPIEFYFVTGKSNESLMNRINLAMEQIVYNRKGFQATLSQKYFSVDMSGTLSFTEEERDYIERHPTVSVALPAMRKPLAYWQNGGYHGVVVDILNEIASRIGVEFRYIDTKTQTEGVRAVANGEIDVISNAYYDYGWAEQNGLFLSNPYMAQSYVAITHINNNNNNVHERVAAVRGYRFTRDYVEKNHHLEQIEWYDNESDCIEAVRDGECDKCYVNSLLAANFLSTYENRSLVSSSINYSHGLSMGVSRNNSVLHAILDKGAANLSAFQINKIVDQNTMRQALSLSFTEFILRYPVQFMCICGTLLLISMALVLIIIICHNNRIKNNEICRARLTAERDSLTGLYNRLAFEVVVTQALQVQKTGQSSAFVMLDIDRFKQINDQNGHDYGDKILACMAHRMREYFETRGALLCRMGGDEFAMFFPELTDTEEFRRVIAEGHRKMANACEECAGIACSLGVAMVNDAQRDFFALYVAADRALYQAKRDGRGRVAFDDEQTENVVTNL